MSYDVFEKILNWLIYAIIRFNQPAMLLSADYCKWLKTEPMTILWKENYRAYVNGFQEELSDLPQVQISWKEQWDLMDKLLHRWSLFRLTDNLCNFLSDPK